VEREIIREKKEEKKNQWGGEKEWCEAWGRKGEEGGRKKIIKKGERGGGGRGGGGVNRHRGDGRERGGEGGGWGVEEGANIEKGGGKVE